ncbi:MAG: hypothetical protein M1527_06755 [Gammaproteobacteria bacterium]|nr:hypothetical protein [Gammaproteobacteria bacterium]
MDAPQNENNAAVGQSGLSDGLGGGITPKQAMDALRKAMEEDYGYAWSWHCNVAMAAVDAGAPHKEANERAAGFMRNAFGVDTRLPPNVK